MTGAGWRLGEPPGDGRDDNSDLVVDASGARWLRRHHAGGVAVLTTVSDDIFRGATVSAWIVASLEPFQILVSLEEESQMIEWASASGGFTVNVLSWADQYLADQFAGFTPRASPRFSGIAHSLSPTGAPIFDRSIAWVDCRLAQVLETGDHCCLLGNVSFLGIGNGEEDDPLVYYLSRYRRFR